MVTNVKTHTLPWTRSTTNRKQSTMTNCIMWAHGSNPQQRAGQLASASFMLRASKTLRSCEQTHCMLECLSVQASCLHRSIWHTHNCTSCNNSTSVAQGIPKLPPLAGQSAQARAARPVYTSGPPIPVSPLISRAYVTSAHRRAMCPSKCPIMATQARCLLAPLHARLLLTRPTPHIAHQRN